MNELILHVGLNKTGTTFLQNNIFPQLDNTKIVNPTNLKFQINGLFSENKNILISHEGLLGVPFNYKRSWLDDQLLSIKNINKTFNNVKIIIGFRDHDDLILSLYKQYLHEGGYLKFNDFYNFNNTGILKPDDLIFEKRILSLKKYFGENVFIYHQSDLKSNLELFLYNLSLFVTNKNQIFDLSKRLKKGENIGVGYYQSILLRKLNFFSDKYINLNNKIFKYIGIDPRKLCQNKLRFISKKSLALDNKIKCDIISYYKSDYNFLLENLNATKDFKKL